MNQMVWRRFLPWIVRIPSADAGLARRMHSGLIGAVAVMTGIILAAGCGAVETPAEPDAGATDAASPDALPPDASPDPACTRACLTEMSLRECTGGEHEVACPLGCVMAEARCRTLVPSNQATAGHLMRVTAALTVEEDAEVIIDTDQGVITVDGAVVRGPGVDVKDGINFQHTAAGLSIFAVQSMSMGAGSRLRALGSRPLFIVSAGDVEIAGTIDVSAGCESGSSSEQRICGGPGGGRGASEADAATGCGPGANGGGGGSAGDHGGGGGGGFGTPGAAGGGDDDGPGGSGGQMCETSLIPLRGGSGGGRCGDGFSACKGGGGGGALQITSYTAIRLMPDAVIDAGGNGGSGHSDGGGGGGAGGGILLEAPVLSIDGAVIAANGGGGGGTSNTAGEDGQRGTEQAAGRQGGGNGGAFAGPPTAGARPQFGLSGGGGGGAAGLIRFHVPSIGYSSNDAVVSPAYVREDPESE